MNGSLTKLREILTKSMEMLQNFRKFRVFLALEC